MKKDSIKRGGKKVFLLGKDKEGIRYWLCEPSWDCGWYWGFGYVHSYANNDYPTKAYDIDSHQHFDGLFLNTAPYYVEAWNNLFKESALNDDEVWKLMELMKTAYTLKETAEMYCRGGSHITSNPCHNLLKNEERGDEINQVLLPTIFKEIETLLQKEKKGEKVA